MFVKGKSGNPNGRRNKNFDIVALCRSYAPEAVKRLHEIAHSPDTPQNAAVSALNSLLDRGFGKPAQAVVGPDGGPVTIRIEWANTASSPHPAIRP